MTTPGGVPNLPQGALTLDTLASKTQDMTVAGMRGRANERVSTIFGSSTGGDVTSDLSPLGVITKIFSGFSSVVANADPADIQGPEDLPGLLLDFIESLPVIGQLLDLLEAISGTYTGDDDTLLTVQAIFAPIRAVVEAIQTAVGDADLSDFFNLDGATSILGAIVNGIGDLINSLVNGGQPINVLNLFGQLTQGLFGVIPASAISSDNPNLLNNPGFDGSISMDGDGVWTWDPATGHTTLGSASTVANSSLKALLSNAVTVAQGQKLTPSVWVRTVSYTGSGTPLRLAVRTYLAGAQVSTSTIQSIAGPGSTWTQMTGTFTVPSGVDSVRIRLVVDTTATGGTVWFDDASLTKPGNGPFDGILQLFGLSSLEDLFDGLDIDDIWSTIISVILNPLGLLEDTIGRGDLSNTVDTIFQAINGTARIGTLLSELLAQLQNIPFLNIGGVAGPQDIGNSVLEFLNQLVGGLTGTPGTGATLPDVFNVTQLVSGWASQGRDASDVLAIRGNKSLKTGFLPSSQSNIGFDKIAIAASPPTVTVTPTTALTAYERISESISIGAVSWQGFGTTNMTSCVVNIYLMDQTSGLDTLVYTSSNLLGLLAGGTTPVPVVHTLSTPINAQPTEVYGFEICVRGSGASHSVAGATSWIADQTTFPLRWAARRDSSSTLSPSTRTPSYSGDVMFFEYAVSASTVVIPHSPSSTLFNTASTSPTLPVPSWANTVQVIQFGNGGGGRQGGTWGVSGEGGDAGEIKTTTWTRGTHFLSTATPILAISIGAIGRGGAHSGNSSANGEDGGNVSVTLPATTGHSAVTVTANGGEGGDALNALGSDRYGQSPGNVTYDSVPYVGGVEQSSYSSDGSAPGGGGSGGDPVAFGDGGNGAVGAVWVRFKQ